MASRGTKISEATVKAELSGTDKFPISDGSGEAKAVTADTIKDYCGGGSGKVNDVLVDGTSVLDSAGNANVDLTGKVDKVSGKGLSTNDYSNTEKAQVAANKTAIATETSRATGVEGGLANLTTTEKSSLVGAINEVKSSTTDLEQKVSINTATTLDVQGTAYCDFKNIGKNEQGDLYNLTVKKGVTYTFDVTANDDISDQVGVALKVINTGDTLAYTILSADKKEDTITYTPTEDIAHVCLFVIGNSDGCCSQVVVYVSVSSNLTEELGEKANNDGYYESMRVGTADNITPKGDGKEETITSRETGGDNEIEDGDAIIQSIHGSTIVLNQYADGDFTKGSFTSNEHMYILGDPTFDSGYALFPTTTSAWKSGTRIDKIDAYGTVFAPISGHKYLHIIEAKSDESAIVQFTTFGTSNKITLTNTFNKYYCILEYSSSASLYVQTPSATGSWCLKYEEVIDLTQMFGSGNEPSTVESFANMLGYDSIDDVPYIAYNTGELVSMKATGIKTTDTDGTEHTRSWASTISTYFPNGMRSNRDGSKIDILGATSAVRYFDVRAYQSGDESNTSVITDGTTTQYELASPVTSTYDELNLTEQVAEGGKEEYIVEDGVTSAPLVAVIKYPIDAYNTIMSNKNNIGTMSALKTTDQSSLVAAINELATKVSALTSTSSTSTEE